MEVFLVRVLLTGGTGFIGREVYRTLQNSGIDIHLISRKTFSPMQKIHTVDILDYEATNCLIKVLRPDALIHLAWDVSHGEFWSSSKNRLYTDASINLFDSFLDNGGEKIIATGTCAEYSTSELPVSEESKIDLHSLTPYGQEKRRLSQWLTDRDCNFSWLRIFGIYGPGENPSRLIPIMVKALDSQIDFKPDNPSAFFDYVPVKQVGELIASCLKMDGLGILNIGTGESCAVADLYQALRTYFAQGVFYLDKQIMTPDSKSRIPDCKKIKKLGYKFIPDFSYINRH